jgi:hypothetical protein
MLRLINYLSLLSLMVLLVGCQPEATTDETKDDKKKPRVEIGELRVLPASSLNKSTFAKSNHWMQTRQSIKVNHADEKLDVSNTAKTRDSLQRETTHHFNRNITIAKAQSKNIEQTLYFGASSQTNESELRGMLIESQVSDRSLGTLLELRPDRVSLMKDYQTHFVILAKNVDSEKFWEKTSVASWPGGRVEGGRIRPYQCTAINEAEIKDYFPNTFQGLGTTSTIYWSDVPADSLTKEQQDAILDWLHFGGRLIVNGPRNIASLANSFLSPYLPLSGLKNTDVGVDAAVVKLQAYTVPYATNSVYQPPTFGVDPVSETSTDDADSSNITSPDKIARRANLSNDAIDNSYCESQLNEKANWIGDFEGLLAERAVGAGRVCMSAFDLSSPSLASWDSYGSLLHSIVFRLPARDWRALDEMEAYQFDPRRAREEQSLQTYSNLHRLSNSSFIGTGENAKVVLGGSGWSSQSAFNRIALERLEDLAGINVPPVSYLTKLIGMYLVVLVPANWIIFRVLRKLEWAWFVIPIIAIGGAAVIARLLQVQIGFVRSQNSIAMVELQNGHPRAQVSSYLSLYTSLSSRFALSTPPNNGHVFPLSVGNTTRDEPTEITYRTLDDSGSGIRGLPVRSHTAALFSSDEMIDLEGALTVTKTPEGRKLVNSTSLQIRDVVWVFYVSPEVTQYYWAGTIEPAGEVNLNTIEPQSFEEITAKLTASLEQSFATNENEAVDDEEVARAARKNYAVKQTMMTMLTNVGRSRQSDSIVGWCSESLSKVNIEPKPSQVDDQTILCLSVFSPTFPAPERDVSLPPLNYRLQEEAMEFDEELLMEDPQF